MASHPRTSTSATAKTVSKAHPKRKPGLRSVHRLTREVRMPAGRSLDRDPRGHDACPYPFSFGARGEDKWPGRTFRLLPRPLPGRRDHGGWSRLRSSSSWPSSSARCSRFAGAAGGTSARASRRSFHFDPDALNGAPHGDVRLQTPGSARSRITARSAYAAAWMTMGAQRAGIACPGLFRCAPTCVSTASSKLPRVCW